MGGGGWVNTHNVVKPTSTWLWLSWVLTISVLYLPESMLAWMVLIAIWYGEDPAVFPGLEQRVEELK